MNTIDLVELGRMFSGNCDNPTPLFHDDQHAVYWLGVPEMTPFRCNTYLLVDGQEAIVIDPGCENAFDFVKMRVAQILPPEKVTALIICHQDLDGTASMTGWLAVNPSVKILTSIPANFILPHDDKSDSAFVSMIENPVYTFESGRRLKFIESPFLCFPWAFTTYDEASKFLFSGDIWAAIEMEWRLVVEDFEKHESELNCFHRDHMASNIAARGFINRLRGIEINAILPRHSSIIPGKHVQNALAYLNNLRCGLDLIYPE